MIRFESLPSFFSHARTVTVGWLFFPLWLSRSADIPRRLTLYPTNWS